MRQNPEKFISFVLGTFMFVYYLGLGYQIFRVQRRIGKSPLVGFRHSPLIEKIQAGSSLVWPLFVLGWAYCPAWFRGIPALSFLEIWPIRLAGLLCLCLGASIIWIAYTELGDSWRIGVDPTVSATFVRTGIYASIRHPVYSALWLWFFGMFLLVPNLFFGLMWALVSTIVVFQAYREEAFLCAKFGKTYQDYMQFTGRFFPLLY